MKAEIKSFTLQPKIQIITKILVVLAAFTFIFYRLSVNFEISQNLILFARWSNQKTILLISCILMMIINWSTESVKWKLLLKKIEKISIYKSLKSVLIGLTYAIFTPYRLGEYAGRPTLIKKENKFSAILAMFVGSISQSITTIGFGLIGMLINENLNKTIYISNINRLTIITTIIILAYFAFVYFYFNPSLIIRFIDKSGKLYSWKNKIHFLSQYKTQELLIVLIYSHFRYLVFFFQYYILLYIFDVHIGLIQAFSAISLGYLFLFSIPGIPIAEIGIRGSLALYFIGSYTSNEIAIILASTSLWIINLALPSVIGSVFLMILKDKVKKSL